MKRHSGFFFVVLMILSVVAPSAHASPVRKKFDVPINLKKYISGQKKMEYTQDDGDLKRLCRENGYFGGYELAGAFSIFCLGDSEAVASHQVAEANRRKNKYFELFSRIEQPDFQGKKWMLHSRSDQLDEIYKTLEIEVPIKGMEVSVDKYRILMNRRPKHKKLVIGCGSLPTFSESAGDVHYIDDYGGDKHQYRANHKHGDADTIDPDFARNPTFVGEFGETPMHELFNGHKYKEIFIEGIRILPWDLEAVGLEAHPQAISSLIALLDDDGIVNDGNQEHFTKAQLVKYLKSKKKEKPTPVYSAHEQEEVSVEHSPHSHSHSVSQCDFNSESVSPIQQSVVESADPLATWQPSKALKAKASLILANTDSDTLEGFLKKYDLKMEDLNLNQAQLSEVLNVHSWINFEYYILRRVL